MMRCQMNRNFEVELTTLCMIRNQKNEILVQERQKRIGLVGRFLADMLKKTRAWKQPWFANSLKKQD